MSQMIQNLVGFFKDFNEEQLIKICLAMDKKNNYLLGFCFERFIQEKMMGEGISLSVGWYKVYSQGDTSMKKPIAIAHLCPSYTPYEDKIGKMFDKIYPRVPVYHINYNPLNIKNGDIKVIYNGRVMDSFPYGRDINEFKDECIKSLCESTVSYGEMEQAAVDYLHNEGNLVCDYCIESVIMSYLFGEYKLINIDGIANAKSLTGKDDDEDKFIILEMKNKSLRTDKGFWMNVGEAKGLNEFQEKGVPVLLITSIDDVQETYRKLFSNRDNEIHLLCYPVDKALTTFPTRMAGNDEKYQKNFKVYVIDYCYFLKFSNFKEIYDNNIKNLVKRHYETLKQYSFDKDGIKSPMSKLQTLLHLYHYGKKVDLPFALERAQKDGSNPVLQINPKASAYLINVTGESSFLVSPRTKSILGYFDNNPSGVICITQSAMSSSFDDFQIIGIVRRKTFLKEMVPVTTDKTFVRMNEHINVKKARGKVTVEENLKLAKDGSTFCTLAFRQRVDNRVWPLSVVERVD